eukprot:NODE_21236_length_763_cov_1.819182.p2 GENE.NODE_21236_length_763_cov_1.819182~~NODE_21236_length_763_cov_1.819182.p2  ORF type:complete len:77 (-),score=14.05 NODE_21236_length_763_cov_1.819182:58-288(-)
MASTSPATWSTAAKEELGRYDSEACCQAWGTWKRPIGRGTASVATRVGTLAPPAPALLPAFKKVPACVDILKGERK